MGFVCHSSIYVEYSMTDMYCILSNKKRNELSITCILLLQPLLFIKNFTFLNTQKFRPNNWILKPWASGEIPALYDRFSLLFIHGAYLKQTSPTYILPLFCHLAACLVMRPGLLRSHQTQSIEICQLPCMLRVLVTTQQQAPDIGTVWRQSSPA